ncbi:hypothetical protein F5X97DRAFT_184058 [Nemania serpens]|nr:hypothetical protein F5X97DRAFT_184058 [Nemania serpens]
MINSQLSTSDILPTVLFILLVHVAYARYPRLVGCLVDPVLRTSYTSIDLSPGTSLCKPIHAGNITFKTTSLGV